MVQTCSKCSRLNPREALYCYYDGTVLDGRGVNGGPVHVGTQAFLSPFVFPSGRVCRNFDQLALACQENWSDVVELLQQGYLESFLSSQGRIDLAMAARAAARSADRDRGLDQFLTKLPSEVLQPPQLRVEPREISLGILRIGENRHFDIVLANQGMRLLHGSVTCLDCPWLALGDPPVQQKLFQCHGELTLPVHIRGQYLRASTKPLEGQLVVETSGGNATVLVRVEVPIKPFPEGVLAGALTPRQVAEKAKAAPRDAAVLMENGLVARWYKENGWTYPVPGPPASGLGAVQQFFEALGLTTPPKVNISELVVNLQGNPGQQLQHTLTVKTKEKRPVYAHGASDRQWLEVGRTRLKGQTATIPLTIPAVPNQPGQTLQAKVRVAANGNQRFVVIVNLVIGGIAVARPFGRGGTGIKAVSFPTAALTGPGIPVQEAVEVVEPIPVAVAAQPLDLEPIPQPRLRRAEPREKMPGWVHWLPICLLALGLFVVIVRDMFISDEPAGGPNVVEEGLLDPYPRIALHFHDQEIQAILGHTGMKPAVGPAAAGTPVIWEPSMRFGLVMQDPSNPGLPKRLTFMANGLTNNTCVRLDGNEWLFGERPWRKMDGTYTGGDWPGRWQNRDVPLGKDPSGRQRQGKQSVWIYDAQKVLITQTVEIVPGQQSRLLDTCLIRYRMENQDSQPHQVGLRFLLDTYIGANDGVPFTIPGASQLCDTSLQFTRSQDVPDFIQALERPDLKNPGTIAHIQLRLGRGLDPPDRVTLGVWPNVRLQFLDPRCQQEKTLWEVPVLSMKSLSPPDSAVTIYWNERLLGPGEKRDVGFAYGLGTVSSSEGGGQLALTVGGSFTPGGEFTVTAYVNNPGPGQTLTLELPPGFDLVEGSKEQPVPLPLPGAQSRNSPVTWKVKAPDQEGTYPLKVRLSTGVSQTQQIRIRGSRLFD